MLLRLPGVGFLVLVGCAAPGTGDAPVPSRGTVAVTLDVVAADLPEDREAEFAVFAHAEGGAKRVAERRIEPGASVDLSLVPGDWVVEAWFSWEDPALYTGDSGGPDAGSTYIKTDCEAEESIRVWAGEVSGVELRVQCSSLYAD